MGQTLNKIRREDKCAARAVGSPAVRRGPPPPFPSSIAILRKAERDGARKQAKEAAKALKRSSLSPPGSATSRPNRDTDTEKQARARKEAAYKKAVAAEAEQHKQNERDRLRERKWGRDRAKAEREREEAGKRAAARRKAKHERQRRKSRAERAAQQQLSSNPVSVS